MELPGHLQPGTGFGTRNHSVSRAVLRRPESGCCSLPEHGVRRMIPVLRWQLLSWCPRETWTRPRMAGRGDLPGEGHQESGRDISRVRRQRPVGRVEGLGAGDKTQWEGVVLDPEDPRLRAGGQTDGQVISVLLLSARLKHQGNCFWKRLQASGGRWGRGKPGCSTGFPERKQRRYLQLVKGPTHWRGHTWGRETAAKAGLNAGARCAAPPAAARGLGSLPPGEHKP